MSADSSDQNPRRYRLWLLTFLCVDGLKQALLMGAGPVQIWPDALQYWELGRSVAADDWWLVQSRQAYRTPLYPWFLGLCQGSFGAQALWMVAVFQHGLELAVSLLTVSTVRRITGSHRAALASYACCILLTARPLYANAILTETWATFLLALLLWLFVEHLDRPRWITFGCAAGVLGLSVLVRPAAVAFVPALAWVGWTPLAAGTVFSRRWQPVVAALAIFAGVVGPWCVRNAVVWNRFTVSVFLGRELWTANFSPWPGAELDVPETGPGEELRSLLRGQMVDLRHNGSVSSALSRSGLDDVAVDDLMKQVALQAIWKRPVHVASRIAARCLTFWYVKDWEVAADKYPAQELWNDQASWSNTAREETLKSWLRWTPERSFPAMWLWSALTWLGTACLIFHSPTRRHGIALAALMLGLTALTAALEIPYYRYRCVLEPAMVAATVSGAATFVCSGKSRKIPQRESYTHPRN